MRLEFPEKKHEKAYLEMIKEFANANEKIIPEATNLKKGETYDDFLQRIKNSKEGKSLKPGYVAGTLYFLINNKERIV
jgi:predicted acetyltransferase